MTGNAVRRDDPAPTEPAVPFRTAVRVWFAISLQTFGGPAGQIAVMQRTLVDDKRWIGQRRFLHAMNYCMLLPGPEAQQLATYVGWLLHGTRGGLVAGGFFVLPGVLALLALSAVYVAFGSTVAVSALFAGLAPAVLAIVFQAVIRIGRRALNNRVMRAIAAAAFVAIYFFAVPFPLIIAVAAAAGLAGSAAGLSAFSAHDGHAGGDAQFSDAQSLLGEGLPAHARATLAGTLTVAATWSLLWAIPVGAIVLMLGPHDTFSEIALFFSKVAMVTFGGAYAVLAYVAQQATGTFGWLRPGEMLDGLGMAETTPGPLIMVTQFVGFMAAWRDPGALHPMVAGTLGGLLTTWVTFVPCFLWIFLGAPYIEALRGNRALTAALSAITAAVVGVILNLAVWFAVHTWFAQLAPANMALMMFDIPVVASIRPWSVALSIAAMFAIFRFRAGMLQTLAGCAIATAVLYGLGVRF